MNTSNSTNLLNKSSNTTAIVSYCSISSVKIAIGVQFTNSPTAKKYNLCSSIHPIFAIPVEERFSLWYEATNPTEKYLSLLSILVGTGLLRVRDPITTIEGRDIYHLKDRINKFILVANLAYRKLKDMELPIITTSKDEPITAEGLSEHLKLLTNLIQAQNTTYSTMLILSETERTNSSAEVASLYARAEKEATILATLKNKPTVKTIKANKSLFKWALSRIASNVHYSKSQTNLIKMVMQSNYKYLKEGQLRDAIELVKEGLAYKHSEREKSLTVIRMLEAKLEDLLAYEQSYGIIEVSKETVTSADGSSQYTTATKTEVSKDFTIALSNLKAKALARKQNKDTN